METINKFLSGYGLKLEMCNPSWANLVDKCQSEEDYQKVIAVFEDYHDIEEEDETPAPVPVKPINFGDYSEDKAKERAELLRKRQQAIKQIKQRENK